MKKRIQKSLWIGLVSFLMVISVAAVFAVKDLGDDDANLSPMMVAEVELENGANLDIPSEPEQGTEPEGGTGTEPEQQNEPVVEQEPKKPNPLIGGMSFVLDALKAFTEVIGIPSYAIAIVLFTIIIKLLVFPLNWKQQVSMRKMAEVQPIQAKLQKKYGHNKELYNQKIMELYKRRKINPMSGCLPMLIQLPIIWCFYRMLLNHDYGTGPAAQFFGFVLKDPYNNLSDPRSYILPILVGATMFLVMKITSMTQTPKKTVVTNAKGKTREVEPPANPMMGSMKYMNIFMSIFFVFIMFSLPSGMALYFLTYNLAQLLQTILTNKYLDAQKQKKVALQEAEAGGEA
ncbi:MAG: YidC/Oxa1 family membrane protein insertase [Peptococcaceae bacterium]|nr:YidC/Oxa1 family membrane protein insertase [Peptococcaceae bacterium]